MKRSDIVKLIYDTMQDNHFGQYGEFYKMANDILTRLEDEGMVPEYELPLSESERRVATDLRGLTSGTKVVHVWEKE